MDRNTMMVAICGQATAVILLVSLMNAIVRFRRASRGAPGGTDDLRRIETRLSNVQEALDAVAVEVERISEGQRFTTKLLADRGAIPVDAALGSRAGRVAPSR